MDADCKDLQDLFDFLDRNRTATIAEVERETRRLLPAARIENRQNAFLVVEFKTSLPCYKDVTRGWSELTNLHIKSPPPLGPNQGPIEYSSIEENPFHWVGQEYMQFGRVIWIECDHERIKSVRIDPPKS